jgi:hypothetical protein
MAAMDGTGVGSGWRERAPAVPCVEGTERVRQVRQCAMNDRGVSEYDDEDADSHEDGN